jgi:hypothetical protein
MLSLDECLDLLELHYQYKHSSELLVNFRALTYTDGDVYIEYRVGRKQYNEWVNLTHPNIMKRIESVSEIEEVFVTDVFDNPSTEVDWGQKEGTEFW